MIRIELDCKTHKNCKIVIEYVEGDLKISNNLDPRYSIHLTKENNGIILLKALLNEELFQ